MVWSWNLLPTLYDLLALLTVHRARIDHVGMVELVSRRQLKLVMSATVLRATQG